MKNAILKYAACSIIILFGWKIHAEQPQGRQMKVEPAGNYEPISCAVTCTPYQSNVWVDVTFSNTTSVVVGMWERNLLKEASLTWSAFEVFLNGKEVEYIGKEVKRPAPGPSEFYKMKPGEVCKARLDLSQHYDLSKAGSYQVRYFSVNVPEGGGKMFFIKSPVASFVKKL